MVLSSIRVLRPEERPVMLRNEQGDLRLLPHLKTSQQFNKGSFMKTIVGILLTFATMLESNMVYVSEL